MDFSYAATASTADWQEWIGRNIDVRNDGIGLATTVAIDRSTIVDGTVDVAVDSSGALYTLRKSGALYRHDPTTDLTHRLWSRTDGEDAARDPCTLCVGDERVFVVDGTDGSVTAISPRLQRTIGTIETDTTDPRRIAYADDILYLLDGAGRIRTLGGRDDDSGLSVDWWLVDPVDLAVDPDGRGYVLDRNDGDPVIRSFAGDEERTDDRFPITESEFVAGDGSFSPTALSVAADRLVVAGQFDDGGPALFELGAESAAFRERYRFAKPCQTLAARPVGSGTDDRCEFYAVTGSERRCHALREVQRNARHPRRERHVGTAFHRYDSGKAGTEWHRLTLDIGQSSASTQVRVRYVAADEPTPVDVGLADLEAVPSAAVDALHELGVTCVWELARADVDRLASAVTDAGRPTVLEWQERAVDVLSTRAEADWTTVDALDPDDILLSNAEGRYLFVALELDGSPQSSPRVESVQAFCPRQSYLRYLPELYREDDRSAAFLERYLSAFESVFVDIETEIDRVSRYFDPDGVPSDSLDWLEEWLALETDGDWPEDARRELLSRAPELYKRRGTKAGLRAMLQLYLRHASSAAVSADSVSAADSDAGDPPGSGGSAASAAADGGDATVGDTPSGHRLFFLDGGDLECTDRDVVRRQYPVSTGGRQSFAVFCGPFDTDDERETIETIVTTGKPAHVGADVIELDDEWTFDGDTFLGINSRLTDREFALGETALGEDTVLVDREPSA